jgi:hypothetical protein
MKLRTNPLYINYLRENNIWYKRLIRNPKDFKIFVEEMKSKYKLRPSDRLEKVVDTLGIVSNLINNMI